MLEAYQRAAKIYNINEKKAVLNETVSEKWIKGTGDFWFAKDVSREHEDPDERLGQEYVRYIKDENALKPLFNHEKLAALIAPEWAEKADPFKLPAEIHEAERSLVYLTIKDVVGEFAYDTEKNTLTLLRLPLHDKNEVTSPDKAHSAYVQDSNIFVRDNKTGKVTQMTFDGEEYLIYGKRFYGVSQKLLYEKPQRIMPPGIVWSPDSKSFLTYRADMRLLGKLHLIQSAPINGQPRPMHASYPYALPGDEHILNGDVYIGNIESKKTVKVMIDGKPLNILHLNLFEAEGKEVKFTEDGKTAWLLSIDRHFKHAQGVLIDIEAATARIASEDTYDTFAFVGYFGSAGQVGYSETDLRFLPGTNEFIWHSETEGWLSLYLNDASTGERKRKLAGGGWVARQVKYLDEAKRELYFTGCGKEGGDPYYQSLYRVHLDTLDIVKLTQETAEHNIRFQPEGGYYIDTFSTIQTAPVSAVYNLSGEKLLDLAAADLSRIEECGYITPEPFEALARDGKTPIYGILIKPYNFDPSKKYPVVDYIYGGSQRINTPKAFEFGMAESDPQGGLQSLAQLGFVGIIVDGFATPLREKAIHDYAYQHAEECCGIEDHVCAIKQLAERFPWIDADKVGIWGASGGGYATARALLAFPEFYKVGVSLCGDHDQAKYHAHWGERWCGAYSEEGYKDQANKTFAKNLEGKLLLIHGDMDDNVHPSATIHLAKALIDENKDFDMLIYPNSHHGVGQFSYVVRRRWDYFVKNLMGEEPPKNFTIREKKEEICGK